MTVAVEMEELSLLHISLCVLVRVCLRTCGCPVAWVCTCACVHVAFLIQHATHMRRIVTSFVAPQTPPPFSTSSHKRRDFREKMVENKMCVLISSTTFV